MTLTDEAGTHEQEEEFVFDGVEYLIKVSVTNTYGEDDECDHGHSIPSTGDYSRSIELLEVIESEMDEEVKVQSLLDEMLEELDKNY